MHLHRRYVVILNISHDSLLSHVVSGYRTSLDLPLLRFLNRGLVVVHRVHRLVGLEVWLDTSKLLVTAITHV